MHRLWLAVAVLVYVMGVSMHAATTPNEFEQLAEGQRIGDFVVECVFVNEDDLATGGRFVHGPSGMPLDLLRIQSVPQAFWWYNTPPSSDQGEPHACEHLVLGKGPKGRYVASLEDMSLTSSSAFTGQVRTCYHYHTTAGLDVFFDLTRAKLDALLFPTFSDEEIRREVAHMGVSVNTVDSSLFLEEKGTVYTEMVSAYENPWWRITLSLDTLLYGAGHPLAMSSGGFPDSMRNMTAEDMREFHQGRYRLGNMGMIVSIPDGITLEGFLQRMSVMLSEVVPMPERGSDPWKVYERLPQARPTDADVISFVEFPHNNPEEPSLVLMAWRPEREADVNEAFLLQLFVDNLAGGQTSNLYPLLIGSETRQLDLGASSVFGWSSDEPGHPITLGLSNVSQRSMNTATLDSARAVVVAEIERIAALADGSDELAEFNSRIESQLISGRRSLREFLSSPPRFGFRGTGSSWVNHLQTLSEVAGFRRDLMLSQRVQFVEELLSSGKNFWTDYIRRWQLVTRKPLVMGSRPSPEMMARLESEKKERLEVFTQGLKERFGVEQTQAALALFRQEYDAKTAQIEAEAESIETPGFIENPPLTLDEQLVYRVVREQQDVPFVHSTFENMTGATVGLAMRTDVVAQDDLMYLAALPALMTEVGVVVDGEPLPFDQMKQRLRREIRGLSVYYDINWPTERSELVVRGAGTDVTEAGRAIQWMEYVLYHPDMRMENLPRLRDVVDQQLSSVRNRMRGSEESWVEIPADAYWKQTNPLMLVTGCFLTQAHALHRLRWQLQAAESESVRDEFVRFMHDMGNAGRVSSHATQMAVLGVLAGGEFDPDTLQEGLGSQLADYRELSEPARRLVDEAVKDLRQILAGDVSTDSPVSDWRYLCRQIAADLAVAPSAALGKMEQVLGALRHTDNVRGFTISSSVGLDKVMPRVGELLTRFDAAPARRYAYESKPWVVDRMQERLVTTVYPVHVGLVNPNTRNGVHVHSARLTGYGDVDRDRLLDFLSARLYGGGGAHSMFMKTWGAGLAYSNGVRASLSQGRLTYYAERCPKLSQTMQFVVDQIREAPYDPSLAEYAVAQAFTGSRAASDYERRGQAMAADLADGQTPDLVRRFREAILDVRHLPGLYDSLHQRMADVYGRVMPGLGPKASEVRPAVYFVIGPHSQLDEYEAYLRSVEGEVRLYRLYPRDYWLPAGLN
jgi:Zn-dependent M16 (insulinase) family peptidase